MIYTTLNRIKENRPCANGCKKLLRHLGKTGPDDEPVSLRTILESNGLDDAHWTLRAVEGHDKKKRLYAVDCARDVQHLMRDPRSIALLDVSERHAHGLASDDELKAARDDAAAAARDAWVEAARTEAAAEAAKAAAAAAAAEAAAWTAAAAAAEAAKAAAAAAEAAAAAAAARAARAEARESIREKQRQRFVEMFCQEDES
jgi:hypothetical protein